MATVTRTVSVTYEVEVTLEVSEGEDADELIKAHLQFVEYHGDPDYHLVEYDNPITDVVYTGFAGISEVY